MKPAAATAVESSKRCASKLVPPRIRAGTDSASCGVVLAVGVPEYSSAWENSAPLARSAAVSASNGRSLNDRDDTHDRYTTSLIQRREQASQQLRQQQQSPHLQRAYDRPSSSSGSAGTNTLRRAVRFGERPSRLRSSSVDSPTRPGASPPRRASSVNPSSHKRTVSAVYETAERHPALRISKRTHSAILYALEEAIRNPNSFTPVESEENALMSDLGGGSTARASNGGARTGGPVPVSSAGGSRVTGIRTPQDIMRDRNAREARRQQEAQREEEQRRAEDRRRSAERRVAAVAGGVPRLSQTSSVYSPDMSAQQDGNAFDGAGDRRSTRMAGQVAGSNELGNPTGRGNQEQSRPRGPSISQSSEQPRPVPTTAGATRRTQTTPSSSSRQPQQPQQSATAGAPPIATSSTAATAPGDGAQRSNQSSFPHAFERWETLSSHWEGLTSYWLHKLEQNTEEIRDSVPNASTLNRQITDLSAAGANLFHAVVELQRLRASSERKFQRWFFETRADNERNREVQAGLERQLKIERTAREDVSRQQTDNSTAVENARRDVAEMRRELLISKEEARRAWEELGRRNQESLDTAQSLKEGRVTIVSGVQVMPYAGGPVSRTGSASVGQRPVTRDGQTGYVTQGVPSAAGGASADDRYYRDGPSPTNTDPFTDSRPQRQQPDILSLAQGTYQPQFGTPASASTAATAIPATAAYTQAASSSQQRSGQPTDTGAEVPRFYQHGGQATMLHSPDTSSANVPTTAAQTAPIRARSDVRSEGSFVETISEGDTEYAIDASGNIRHDEQGRPIVFQRRQPARSSESEDDFDTEQAVRRERELAARYGSQLIPEAPSVPTTSNQAMATYTPTAGGSRDPDYEGSAYDNYEQYVPRHHYPTRLSDVKEEDEERSSRRTAGD